jgi:multidrug efflux pump
LIPRLSSIEGVGKVDIFGSSPKAVRVELNPTALSKYGIGLEDISATLSGASVDSPKGSVDVGLKRFEIYVDNRVHKASDYRDLVIAYRNGSAVKLGDVGEITDSVEQPLAAAFTNRTPSILLRIYRTTHANIIATIDRIKDRLVQLQSILPGNIDLKIVSERTATIRATLKDLEEALVIAGVLVILTVLAFLQNLRAIIIPLVVIPVSILGTFCCMALLGLSLNVLTLMALIIAAGLVIDDSVIVVENIMRHMEAGLPRLAASLRGAEEVGFTVLATSISLIAIFIPFFFLNDVSGRMLREFAVTLSSAVSISFLVSMTSAPMLCAVLLKRRLHVSRSRFVRAFESSMNNFQRGYARSLSSVLGRPKTTLAVLGSVTVMNAVLYMTVPKNTLPEQDPGWLIGEITASPNISVTDFKQLMDHTVDAVLNDPDVADVNGQMFGSGTISSAEIHVRLAPRARRNSTARAVERRLSEAVSMIPGVYLELYPPQDVHLSISADTSDLHAYELAGDDIDELRTWTQRLTDALKTRPEIANLTNDQQMSGFDIKLLLDRSTAARLGISASQFDNALGDAFSERSISTIFDTSGQQQQVLMAMMPRFRRDLNALAELYVSTSAGIVSGSQSTNAPIGSVTPAANGNNASQLSEISSNAARNRSLNSIAAIGNSPVSTGTAVSVSSETMVPLAAISHIEEHKAPFMVRHNGGSVVSNIRFKLASGIALSQAISAITETAEALHMPPAIHRSFSGLAEEYQNTSYRQLYLIVVTLVTLYLVLGILYESFIYPLTILSTFLTVGAGAIPALMFMHMDFTIVAFIGIILLTGLVMKNAIMMIDVAIDLERNKGLSPRDAIYNACCQRFRPIMMTSVAALFGAIPLIFSSADGAELRQPLGVTIAGGLIVSQILTLYTIPIVHLTFANFCARLKGAYALDAI